MNASVAADHQIPAETARILTDPKAYADGRIYEAYRWLRAHEPLGVAKSDGYDPFWVVAKHADLMEASRRNDDFLNGARSSTLVTQEADAHARATPRVLRTLINMDAPDHPKFRLLTQAWFAPKNLRRLDGEIRAIARNLIDKMAAAGEFDFVDLVALHYPLYVLLCIFGAPLEDEPRILRLTQQILGASDPELARDGEVDLKKHQANPAAVAEFLQYFQGLAQARRQQPTEDLATVLAHAEIDGRPISPMDMMGYYMIVATAGHDTTSSSLAGTLEALITNPAELKKVQADPALIASLVDEGIRWTTPVKDFMRTASRDTVLGGREIKQGDWLMLCYASANRDEDVFEAPDAFRVDRANNRHIAFGYGGHLCIGQHLAKMELRIFFEELLPRLKSIEAAGEAAWIESYFINGPKRLPIRVRID
jgi:cytochrome P450